MIGVDLLLSHATTVKDAELVELRSTIDALRTELSQVREAYQRRTRDMYAREDSIMALRAEVEALKEIAAYNHDTAMRVGALLEAAEDRDERLAEALRVLLGCVDDLTAYDNEDDEIGHRPCCHVLSYKPHSDDCKVAIARVALEQESNDA